MTTHILALVIRKWILAFCAQNVWLYGDKCVFETCDVLNNLQTTLLNTRNSFMNAWREKLSNLIYFDIRRKNQSLMDQLRVNALWTIWLTTIKKRGWLLMRKSFLIELDIKRSFQMKFDLLRIFCAVFIRLNSRLEKHDKATPTIHSASLQYISQHVCRWSVVHRNTT